MNFEKHTDPKKSLGIGKSQQRKFDSVEEIAQWCFLFPKECSSGEVYNWFGTDKNGNLFFDFEKEKFNENLRFPSPISTEGQSAMLFFVRWIKQNIDLNYTPNFKYNIGLKESKQSIDRLEEIIMEIYQNEFIPLKDGILEKLKNKYNAH